SVAGQLRLGFPVVGQMGDLQASQLERIGPLAFIGGNLEFLGPLALLAITGLYELLRRGRAPAERAVGWAAGATFALLMLLQGKPYYVGPIYPALFAAGAVWVESRGRSLRWAAVALVAAFGIATLPFGVPLLPPRQMA